jgi:hypothetical protein
VRGDHDLVGLVLGHAEFRLQDRDDEFARREVVVDEDDLVQPRPFGLGLDLGFRLGDGVDHAGQHLLTFRRNWKKFDPSFRGDAKQRTTMCNCTSENLEIPRCAIAYLRSGPSDHPGMTKDGLFRFARNMAMPRYNLRACGGTSRLRMASLQRRHGAPIGDEVGQQD